MLHHYGKDCSHCDIDTVDNSNRGIPDNDDIHENSPDSVAGNILAVDTGDSNNQGYRNSHIHGDDDVENGHNLAVSTQRVAVAKQALSSPLLTRH